MKEIIEDTIKQVERAEKALEQQVKQDKKLDKLVTFMLVVFAFAVIGLLCVCIK